MKLISTIFSKNHLAVILLSFSVTFANARVFWNKFEVIITNDNTVVLNWNVTEYNNKSFRIQHSTNGTDWIEIAVIQSKNSSESMVDYSYTHTSKHSGKQFYRIGEVDLDVNNSGYSPIRMLTILKEAAKIGIWPNPATNYVLISNDSENIYTKACVFDLTGKVVAARNLDAHTNRIAINELPAGTYIVQIENDKGAKYSQKIVKQ